MAAYSYQALDNDGRINRGIIEGESDRQVRALLRARKLKPITVELSQSGTSVRSLLKFERPLSLAQRTLLTRQLATLVKAGVPLDEALAATARQAHGVAAKTLMLQLRSKVVAGQSFHASLAAFPQHFSDLYQALTRAGEQAGLLGEVLDRLADYLDLRQQLQHKLQMAMIYPCTLIAVAVLVVSILMVFVLPDLGELFSRNGGELPLLTRMLMGFSSAMGRWWPLLLVLLLLLPPFARTLLRQPVWQQRWHRLCLRLPLVGRLSLAADTARFASTLSLLTASGVSLVEAMTIATGVLRNVSLRKATAAAVQTVEEGGSLARALDACGFYPPLLTQMVASGESSGSLDAMLARAATMQERELEQTLNGLLKVVEPLLLVLMAVIIGTIVLAVLLPIMQMNTLVQ